MKPPPPSEAGKLRRRAEARLRQPRHPLRSKDEPQKTEADPRRLLHELQVHQVELAMQNAELQEARSRMEALLEKYTDLYDFAPVGYFSLDEQGEILEVNLTGAALLGVERSRLLQRRLPQFVTSPSQPIVLAFLEQVFAGPGKHVCEAMLRNAQGKSFWANFHATSAVSLHSPRPWCRVAVSDSTVLKQAEAVEKALKHSRQDQSQLLEQSRHMQAQLRQLSHQILQAQEEERKRISRELHDEITQTLVGINVHLETLAREARVNPKALKQEIARTQRLVEKSVNIVHRFARELRPTALDDLGLIATLHSFMKDFMKRTGIRVRFTTVATVEQLDSLKRTVLYRVAQAALTNVAQHAHASRVKVSIRKLPEAVRMDITDDGQSFEVERVLRAKRNRHLGLLGMRERVEMVGGVLRVESTPGQGTTIRAQIPIGETP